MNNAFEFTFMPELEPLAPPPLSIHPPSLCSLPPPSPSLLYPPPLIPLPPSQPHFSSACPSFFSLLCSPLVSSPTLTFPLFSRLLCSPLHSSPILSPPTPLSDSRKKVVQDQTPALRTADLLYLCFFFRVLLRWLLADMFFINIGKTWTEFFFFFFFFLAKVEEQTELLN